MGEFVFNIFLLLFSFYALARIVDLFFVETLDIISKRLRLSSDIAGATFMAVGSSAPELFVAVLALFRATEQQSIGAGTIVGSAIFNVLVIVGASGLFKRAILTWQPVIRDLLFYIVTIILVLFTFADGQITIGDALLYVGVYVVYLFSFGIWKKIFPYTMKADEEAALAEDDAQQKMRKSNWNIKNFFDKFLTLVFIDLKKFPRFFVVNFLISILFLIGLSHLLVESAVGVAHYLHIPEVIIALTILAAGTSVPDLLSSINVAKKGYGDMAVSNAVGSNIFDIGVGLGLPWLIMLLWGRESIPVETENLYSSVVLLFATVLALLFLLVSRRWEIGRYAGVILIGCYVFYLLTQAGVIEFEMCWNLGGTWCVGI
ncbi:calcium/sodium antiporter [Patescibacteria group bacterium]|nr:calcium/sodium antiporter [Patescibacteria group bacterium]